MAKPNLIVGGVPVTAVSMPADDITYVQATISAPSKPNAQFTIAMTGLCPVNKSGGTLNASGEADVIFGPSRMRMRGVIDGRLSVPGLNNNAFTVTFS